MVKISNYLKQKGQGIVEYALLLAFVVGIAVALQGVGLASAVKDTFDSVASLLGGEKQMSHAAAVQEWGKMPIENLLAVENDKRIQADQETLASIGALFLGKTKEELKSENLLSNPYQSPNGGFFLGNYYDKYGDTLNESGTNAIQTEYNPQNMGEAGKKAVAEAITAGLLSGGFNYSNSDTRYFYSDEMLKTMNDSYGIYSNDRSIRVELHYDDNGAVDATRVRINRGSLNADNSHAYYAPLDVTVKNNGTWKQTISNADAITMDHDAQNRITVADSKKYNNTWYN